MNTLIIGAAYNYKVEDLKPFVLSLRRHYTGKVLFITGPLTQILRDFFDQYDVITYELEHVYPNPRSIQLDRYYLYETLLTDNFQDVNRVFITDVRDVIFQGDPFAHKSSNSLEFFHEPATYDRCKCNGNWIRTVFGEDEFQRLKDNFIICSGTTMGSREGILHYLSTMISEIEKIKSKQVHLFDGIDQPIHAHSVYSKFFNDYVLYHNGQGPITTVHHQMTLLMDRCGQLLNDDKTVTPIIHQWDRAGRVKTVLEKTAIDGPGPAPEV